MSNNGLQFINSHKKSKPSVFSLVGKSWAQMMVQKKWAGTEKACGGLSGSEAYCSYMSQDFPECPPSFLPSMWMITPHALYE